MTKQKGLMLIKRIKQLEKILESEFVFEKVRFQDKTGREVTINISSSELHLYKNSIKNWKSKDELFLKVLSDTNGNTN